MPARTLFPTLLYEADLDNEKLRQQLSDSCFVLAREDRAGRQWSKANAYAGYTSYSSLNDLPVRDPNVASLVRAISRHVALFAEECGFDLKRKPKLDSLWVNVLRQGGMHSAHIHPHSIISGTYYVEVPLGSGALKIEDPRLPLMMAAPSRRSDAAEAMQSFVYIHPKQGSLLLWESWLRHEVTPGTGKGERISISFNYR